MTSSRHSDNDSISISPSISPQQRPQVQKMKRVPFIRRFHALIILQFHVQRRKYLQNVCLFIFPLVVLLLPIIVSIIAFGERMIEDQIGLPKPQREVRSGNWFSLDQREQECCTGYWTDAASNTTNYLCKREEWSMTERQVSGALDDYYVVDAVPPGDDVLGEAPFMSPNASGFIGFVPRFPEKRYYSEGSVYLSFCGTGPSFANGASVRTPEELVTKIYDASKEFEACSRDSEGYLNPQWKCRTPAYAGHGVMMHRLKTQDLKMEATIASDVPNIALRTLFSGLINKVIQPTGNVTYSPRDGSFLNVGLDIYLNLSRFADISILFLYPVVACFLMPVFASNLIEDRNLGVLQFIELYGVTVFDETLVRCLSDMGLYLVYIFITHAFGALFQVLIFQYSWWMLLLVNPVYGWVQMMAAYTIAPLFKNSGQATVLCYMVLLIASVVGSLLNMFLFTAKDLPPFWFLIFPPWTYTRCIALAVFNYSQYGYVAPGMGQFFICLAIMVAQGILLSLTTTGLLTHLPKRLYYHVVRTFYRLSRSDTNEDVPLLASARDLAALGDEEVQREKQRIQNRDFSEDDYLVIDGLLKEFGTGRKKKVAVKNVYFSAKRGSCTGLIGANGSGKTTLTSMLIGYLRPTRGTAHVCGYDITSQMHQVKKCIGVVPQFEILFPALTVEEHLLFFARLRGIPLSEEKHHVKDILAEIGMEEARRRSAKNLSGGMRRRLALAIALTGSPPLLLLDEPSSGLDPASARGIWDLILHAKKSRCVILTSHSMHEVETLCERIGMIANGSLVCAGDLLDLKRKYVDDYKLKVSCDEHNEERVKNYIQGALPFTEFRQKISGGNLIYTIKSRAMKLSTLFTSMQPARLAQCGIKDWSLDEGGALESVFMHFAAAHDDE